MWGWIFITVTTLIALFKHEEPQIDNRTAAIIGDIRHAYNTLWSIMKLPTIKTMALILLTAKVFNNHFVKVAGSLNIVLNFKSMSRCKISIDPFNIDQELCSINYLKYL